MVDTEKILLSGTYLEVMIIEDYNGSRMYNVLEHRSKSESSYKRCDRGEFKPHFKFILNN